MTAHHAHHARRVDRRLGAIVLTVLAIAGLGAWFEWHDPAPATAVSTPVPMPHAGEVRQRFDAAVVMLHAREYAHAATALHEVLRLAPTLPEAHVNMGFAMLGLQRVREAHDFFDGAMALNPSQANAYYGLALAHEAAGDLDLATGAMRSYLHLARQERPEHLARARAALWEWEQARQPATR